MWNLFKKKSVTQKLEEQYDKLLKESYELSHTNRALSDLKAAEADAILQKIKKLEEES